METSNEQTEGRRGTSCSVDSGHHNSVQKEEAALDRSRNRSTSCKEQG